MEVHAHSRHDVGLVGTWRNFEGGLCVASGSMSALSALLVKGDVACIERIYFLEFSSIGIVGWVSGCFADVA